jgi:hypothetical protein
MPKPTRADDDALFAPLARTFARDARVELPRPETAGAKFGSRGLKAGGHIFAMTSKGHLIVKLPRARVAALVQAGRGEPYVLGARTMKEWVAISTRHARTWRALAEEARDFAAGSAFRSR